MYSNPKSPLTMEKKTKQHNKIKKVSLNQKQTYKTQQKNIEEKTIQMCRKMKKM